MSWNIERVKHLVDFLENLELKENEYFYLNYWHEKDSCETFGCALGWYSVLNTDILKGRNVDKRYFLNDPTEVELMLYCDIFGILLSTEKERVVELYGKPISRITAKDVAQKLRELVLEKKDEKLL